MRLTRSERAGFPAFAGGLLVSVCSLSACGGKTPPSMDGPALAQVKVENGGAAVAAPYAHLPVPPEDGPKLAPTLMVTPILGAPERGAPAIGYLRLGSKVSRSAQPVARGDCSDGYY